MSRTRLLWQLLILLAVLAIIALGAWLTGLVSPSATAYVVIGTVVVAALVQAVCNRHTEARGWLLGASIGIAVAAFGAGFVGPSLVLAANGHEVTAMVTGIGSYPAKGGPSYTYSLRQLDGAPIKGELDPPYYDNYRVGDQVTVIEDPAGDANPQLPSDLDLLPWSIVTGAGLALFVASLVLIGRAGLGEDPIWPFVLLMFGIGSGPHDQEEPAKKGATPRTDTPRRRKRGRRR